MEDKAQALYFRKEDLKGLAPGDIPTRRQAYKDWLKSLDQIKDGDKRREAVARALEARDLLIEHLQRRANTDRLTKLPNQRAFYAELQRMIAKNIKFGLLAIDGDGVKLINDTYGHKAGDEAIIQLGELLRDNLRTAQEEKDEVDYVAKQETPKGKSQQPARWGGDEFFAILPDVKTEEELFKIGERLRSMVGNNQFLVTSELGEKIPLRMTISVGGLLHRGETSGELFHKADKEALYSAKNQGGNKVVIID